MVIPSKFKREESKIITKKYLLYVMINLSLVFLKVEKEFIFRKRFIKIFYN